MLVLGIHSLFLWTSIVHQEHLFCVTSQSDPRVAYSFVFFYTDFILFCQYILMLAFS